MIPKSRSSIAWVAVALVCIAASAGAQTPDSTATQPPPAEPAPTAPPPAPAAATTTPLPSTDALRGGVTGELLAINVPRSEDEIQKLLDEALGLEKYAASEIDEGRQHATEADGRAKVVDHEMDVTKEKRNAAKKAKDKAQAEALDATYKQQARQHKYLSQLRDALRADNDRMESAKAAAGAQAKALELELQVVQKQATLGASPPASAVADFKKSLRTMLEAQRAAADKAREAADKRKRVAEERLKQLDALGKVGS